MMQIVTYESKNAPLDRKWCAKWLTTKVIKNKAADFDETYDQYGFLPIVFWGVSENEVYQNATNWWTENETARNEKIAVRQAAAASRKSKVKQS